MPIPKNPASRATKPQQRSGKPKAKTVAIAPDQAPPPTDDALFDPVDAATQLAAPPAPVEPVAPIDAPVTTDEGPAASGAPEEVVDEQPEEAPIEHVAEMPPADPVVDPAADDGADDDELSGSPVASNIVRLGHVDGVLHRISMEVVQDIVASSAERIALLRTSNAVLALQQRVRDTEGRCAPVIFVMGDDGAVPYLFSGIETIAAAMNVELTHVVVVAVPQADAGAAQSYLAQAPHRTNPETEDDLVRQVLAYEYE